jgi:hypothetical protein
MTSDVTVENTGRLIKKSANKPRTSSLEVGCPVQAQLEQGIFLSRAEIVGAPTLSFFGQGGIKEHP